MISRRGIDEIKKHIVVFVLLQVAMEAITALKMCFIYASMFLFVNFLVDIFSEYQWMGGYKNIQYRTFLIQ